MFCEEIKIPGLPGEGTVTDGSVDWYEMDWENVNNGVIEEQQREMINNIFEFDDIPISDVMTHRKELVAINVPGQYPGTNRPVCV